MPRPTLAIDLGAIVANWRALAARARPAACAAVVKADAYGLGAAAVAPALAAAGARSFFAADAAETIELREALGPAPALYALNGADAVDMAAIAAAAVVPVLATRGQVAAARAEAARRGRPLPVALQLDIGMNRLGLTATETTSLLDDPAGLAGLDLRLALGHLSSSDDPSAGANAAERARFLAALAHPRLRGVSRSLAATGGVLLGADFAFDLVRPGIGLFGGLPFAGARAVVRLSLPVLRVADLPAGAAVGYGGAWRADGPRRVATLAAGYADGLFRALSPRAAVYHRGRRLPFAGRVSMDLVTVDATAAPELREGDAVDLLGPDQGIDALAAAAGTLGYEVLTSLGTRHRRRYVAPDPAPEPPVGAD
jgi:alanine racemase